MALIGKAVRRALGLRSISRAYVGEKDLSSKIRWFLVFHRAQRIQGKSSPTPIPVGGRHIQASEAIRVSVNDWNMRGLMVPANGASFQTACAKLQWKKSFSRFQVSAESAAGIIKDSAIEKILA
ncbi:unnamed protein product [Microthlaspi erraticum]|uniref:Uncharacterized protein n=1 Tax=Microthlaspi erraticum TaxID=1685480 RepID=A0A6D2L922_9BRAS|nr:unnamed protein product [Microthlaspi erraticum]